jgi:DNA-binding transcriptional ArsR family regulator
VILDERPDFTADLPQDRIRRAVTAYLQEIDAPVSTWEALVSLARFDHTSGQSDAAREQDALDDALGTDPPTEWYVDDPDAHALAPDLARAVWRALRWEDPDANGRRSTKVLHEPPRFDAGDGEQYAGAWLSVVIDDENTVRTVRATPDFSQARAVVGLDAHPSMPLWEQNAAPGMTRDAVLDPTERHLWRRYERGLTVVQVGDATRPRSGSKAREWTNDERVRTVLDALRDHYGDEFDTAITTTQVEPVVRAVLADVTDEDLDDNHLLHYGEEKSRNPEAFADAAAGYVYGCMDPGDEFILDALAELGLDAEPATATTDDGDEYREKGRTFDGPDADTAQAVLASVRENHVAQAAGRYARDPEDGDGAVVFVHTDATPPGFADLKVPGVEWLATDLQREILEELVARPSATAREIAAAVGCSKDHVRETLARLEAEGLVARHPGAGDHGADMYREDGADGALLDLGLDQTADDPLRDTTRWSPAIWDLHATEDALGPRRDATNGGEAAVATADGADRPPDSCD